MMPMCNVFICVYVFPSVHTHVMFVYVFVCGVCDMYDVLCI